MRSISKNSDSHLPTYALSEELERHITERLPAKMNVREDFQNANFSETDDKLLTVPYESYPAIDMRYSFLNSSHPSIYIRKCYKEIYDLIMIIIINEDERRKGNN